MQQAHRRLILAAAVVALIVRVVFAWTYWTGKPLTHDEREYLSLAASLAEGRGFTYSDTHETGTGQRFGRAPGYPALLALFRPDPHLDAAPRAIQFAQAALLALGVLLIAAIARAAAGDSAALIAAWLAALYPPLIWIPAYVLSESLYLPLALGCTVLLARERRGDIIAAGVLAGIAILVRPAMLLFVPLAAVWLVRRRHVPLAAIFVAVTICTVLPWTIRNMRTYDRFVLVASEGGVTFWTGNHPLARGEGDLAANPALKTAEIEFRRAHDGLSSEALEPMYYRDALRTITERPGWWIVLLGKKAFYTAVPAGPSYTLHSTKYLLTTVVPYAMLAPLAIAGFIRIARHGRPPHFLYLLGASVVLTSLIFFPQERFRIPVIDPLVIVGAAAALAGAFRPTA
jgi:4-amino-4-deoxy-L-arabinose transferase-like glycosyltransferase